ncbi:MAG: hypothetical protein ACPLXM_14145 [Bacteroidales bacterium]
MSDSRTFGLIFREVLMVIEQRRRHYLKDGQAKVLNEEYIEAEYKPEGEVTKKHTK